ncbi:MAG: hypothetical protein ACXVAX_08770 [Pseudobdellovibrio sp.]
MKSKIIFQVTVLLLLLVLVLKFRDYAGSRSFVQTMSDLFTSPKPANTMNWCVDKTVDVSWASDELSENLKKLDGGDLKDLLCEVQTEPILNLEIDKVTWSPLAESHGPTAQKSLLEWNREYSVFRAGGMPFKSSKLTVNLQK